LRDRWFRVGLVGSLVAGLACVTSMTAIALGVIGLGAWAGGLDTALLLLFLGLLLGGAYRYWITRQRSP